MADDVGNRLEELLEKMRIRAGAFLRLCESPIERLLFMAFLERALFQEQYAMLSFCYLPHLSPDNPGTATIYDDSLHLEVGPESLDWLACFGPPDKVVYSRRSLVPQYPIRNGLGAIVSRIDFAFFHVGLVSREEIKIAIECDGHDFHERTAYQAKRDRSKDRHLQELGWLVARFTGSEIVRSPEEVVDEITAMATFRDGKLWEARKRRRVRHQRAR